MHHPRLFLSAAIAMAAAPALHAQEGDLTTFLQACHRRAALPKIQPADLHRATPNALLLVPAASAERPGYFGRAARRISALQAVELVEFIERFGVDGDFLETKLRRSLSSSDPNAMSLAVGNNLDHALWILIEYFDVAEAKDSADIAERFSAAALSLIRNSMSDGRDRHVHRILLAGEALRRIAWNLKTNDGALFEKFVEVVAVSPAREDILAHRGFPPLLKRFLRNEGFLKIPKASAGKFPEEMSGPRKSLANKRRPDPYVLQELMLESIRLQLPLAAAEMAATGSEYFKNLGDENAARAEAFAKFVAAK